MRKNLVILTLVACLVLATAGLAMASEAHILLIAKGEQLELLEEYLSADDSITVTSAFPETLFDTGAEQFSEEALNSYDAFIIGEVVLGEALNGSVAMEAWLQEAIADRVEAGAGFAMIGGWCSYQGGMEAWSGQWHGTPIDEILPVDISADWDTNDEGANTPQLDQPNHPIVAGLDWASVERFGGYNKVTVADGGTVVLSDPEAEYPLITVGTYGAGTTVAYTGGLGGGWDESIIEWADFPQLWLQLARYLVD